jgi:ABC-type uncharacterized transport system involved in gliding motility auxiliary subunit
MAGTASLFGWIGFVFVLFGLIGVVIQIFSGGLFWSRDQLWVWGNLVVGAILLAAGLLGNLEGLRERLRSGEARRAGKYGTSAILSTLLGIALLGLLAFLGTRYNVRWDWTEASTHSLSPQTVQVLEGLERDVQVTALYNAVAAIEARDLLDRYAYASDRFQVTYADPQADPGLVRSLGIPEERLASGLVHVKIGDEAVEVTELDESELTNALVKLTRRERKKVYLLEGHNERATQGEGSDAAEGFAFAAQALENENYVWETLFLAQRGEVPDDADVVVIAGPTLPFYPGERAALQRYMEKGGALLVMVDPRANTNIAEDLAEWGVRLGDDVLVDRLQGIFGQPYSPFAAEYPPHPITEGLRERTLFHVARSVEPAPGSEAAFTSLVRTSEQSWAERDLDRLFSQGGGAEFGADDLRGPVSVAVAGTLSPDGAETTDSEAEGDGEEVGAAPGARLVVFGDSDFATNARIQGSGNRNLFVNSVNWLLGDVEAIGIRPEVARASRLDLTSEQFLQLRVLSLFVLPQTIAVLGVVAWWWRRRAPGR